jgi:hypothetical protein
MRDRDLDYVEENGIAQPGVGAKGLLPPGYSPAARALGFVAAVVSQFPAALWPTFIPMPFTTASYHYMNEAAPDCGIGFSGLPGRWDHS